MEHQKEDISVEKIEKVKQSIGGDTIVEQGSYNMVADTNGDFKITHLVLKSESGAKRVWKIHEMSEKDISFKIEKFG